MFEGNIILLWILGGRVILEENRIPLFLITLENGSGLIASEIRGLLLRFNSISDVGVSVKT